MIWALLAILGVPIWLIVGLLVSVVVSRRRFQAQTEVFLLSIRPSGIAKWPRSAAYGRCFRGVLVVNKGLAFLRTSFYEVELVAELAIDQPPRKPTGPVGRTLTVSDGTSIEIAVAADDSVRLDALTTA